jgi:hypothetical protein
MSMTAASFAVAGGFAPLAAWAFLALTLPGTAEISAKKPAAAKYKIDRL